MSANDFLLDFAIASLFIMAGQLIRAKVGFVQKFFVPASMIAGFIALALGSQGLNILPSPTLSAIIPHAHHYYFAAVASTASASPRRNSRRR